MVVDGRCEEAIAQLDKRIAKSPKDPFLLYNRGQAYLGIKKYQQAMTDFELCTGLIAEGLGAKEPSTRRKMGAQCILYKGVCLKELGRSNDAESAFRLAFEQFPTMEEEWERSSKLLQEPALTLVTEMLVLVKKAKAQLASNDSKPSLDVQALAQQIAAVMKEKQKAEQQPLSTSAGATPPVDAKPVNRPVRDKWALVIGVSKFQDKTIPELRFAAKDAEDFSKFLVNNANFSKDHVRLLTNESATQRRILDELGDKFLPRVVKPDDLVVIYFSSHGSPSRSDVRGKNFLIAHDSEKRNLYASGIEMQQLSDVIKDRVQSDRVLLVLDACHSGATTPGEKGGETDANFNLQAIPLGSGQTVICSSKAEERSWESKRYENGVFTKRLMQALIQDGEQTTIDKAYSHLSKQVEDEVQQDQAAKQTPVFRSTWKGNNLMLCTPAASPEPLPDAVRSLLAPDTQSKSK
ncbi:MAG: caspase family protein [Candidatus Obscuribacterales bacterium]|nr:caspase family protein [Candidatus Obscuribacterales bacterium]